MKILHLVLIILNLVLIILNVIALLNTKLTGQHIEPGAAFGFFIYMALAFLFIIGHSIWLAIASYRGSEKMMSIMLVISIIPSAFIWEIVADQTTQQIREKQRLQKQEEEHKKYSENRANGIGV